MSTMQNDALKGSFVSIRESRPGEFDYTRLDVLFKYNDKFFNVILSDSRDLPGFDESDSIACQYFDRLDDCVWYGPAETMPPELDRQYALVSAEIRRLVQSLCQPLFEEHAAPTNKPCRKSDLHTYMNPEVFQFELVTLNGEPKLVPRTDVDPLNFHPPFPDSTPISAKIPRFPSSSIEVLHHLGRTWVLKVSVGEQTMCCKISSRVIHQSMCPEYTALQQVLDAGLTPPPRVPRLKGVVEEKDGSIVGILMEYIEPSIPDLKEALSGDVIIEPARKAKWAAQIEDTLKQLHGIGVIWGDAKTANIVIDEKDDAWIIDFGGGQTMGWVDYGLVGTKEGDLQALGKIKEALGVQ